MAQEFDDFVRAVRPRLLRAFVSSRGVDGAEDATAEALAWAWEHWSEVIEMENPAGYLFRVGQSRTRTRRRAALPAPAAIGVPDVEPALVPSLLALPATQRTAVWLVHGCGWSYAEVAAAMDTSPTMVGNHVSRGLARLRRALKVDRDA
jgi:RNA polymerase sigma-70 factor (ECF subfamily)